jgi:hypothetical protein
MDWETMVRSANSTPDRNNFKGYSCLYSEFPVLTPGWGQGKGKDCSLFIQQSSFFEVAPAALIVIAA